MVAILGLDLPKTNMAAHPDHVSEAADLCRAALGLNPQSLIGEGGSSDIISLIWQCSEIGGPQHRPQYSLTLLMGTPKRFMLRAHPRSWHPYKYFHNCKIPVIDSERRY